MQGVEVSFSIAGSELSNLERLVGQDLFLQGPFALSGRIHNPSGRVYRIDGLDMSVGDTTLKGLSTVDFSGEQPVLSIELASQGFPARPFVRENVNCWTN